MEALGVALECECSPSDVFVIEKNVKHQARSLRVPIHFLFWLYLGFKYFLHDACDLSFASSKPLHSLVLQNLPKPRQL